MVDLADLVARMADAALNEDLMIGSAEMIELGAELEALVADAVSAGTLPAADLHIVRSARKQLSSSLAEAIGAIVEADLKGTP